MTKGRGRVGHGLTARRCCSKHELAAPSTNGPNIPPVLPSSRNGRGKSVGKRGRAVTSRPARSREHAPSDSLEPAMGTSRPRTSPPSRSLCSRATSPRLRREEEFRPTRERGTPNLIARSNHATLNRAIEPRHAQSRDRRNSSPVERSDSGEVPSAARRRGRTDAEGELREPEPRHAQSRDGRNSSPVERSDSGEVPSAARRRGRTDAEGDLRAIEPRLACSRDRITPLNPPGAESSSVLPRPA